MFKGVIFDLDGTLLDTIEDLGISGNLMLEHYGFPTHPTDFYRSVVGRGMRNLVELCLPEGTSEDIIDQALALFRDVLYPQHYRDTTVPYEGIPELLQTLVEKNLLLGVCSNKHETPTRNLVSELFPGIPFVRVVGQRDGVPRKPDPTAAREIAEAMRLASSEILYIGDSGVDMQTAKNAGMYPLGVLWGYRDKEELLAEGALAIAETPEDILLSLK